MANSQESSKWLKSENSRPRTLTSSLLRAYWDSGLVTSLAWAQFHRIVRTKCRWAIRPVRKTDYCDHCHLLQTSILPGLKKLFARAQQVLSETMPSYFRTFPEAAEADEIASCEAFSRFIYTHGTNRQEDRKELRPMVAQKLHELEAKISHRLTWELKVAKSYHWHRLIAKRQAQASNQVLLWSDYKQNLTVPLAHTETGDMFYGTSRMEMTCWGCLVFQKAGDQLRTKHVIVISSIIEHTVLVSNLLYAEVAKHIDNLPDWRGWIGDWVESQTPRKVRLSFFGEKHGKGQVDGLFSRIEGWIQHHLKRPGRRISNIDEMEQVLKNEAARATKMDPAMEYIVVRWEPEQKPASAWVFPQRESQISKTYCLQLLPDNPNVHVRTTSIVDFTFTEMSQEGQGSKSFPKVFLETIRDSAWRRAYFSNTRWDRKRPSQGQADAVVNRFEEHKRRKMQVPDLEDEWERTARKQANRLLRRRARWRELKQELEAGNAQTSSSSSSSNSSSSSASDK
ncbi:unnamed protein product [Symbiodinium sp. CCMP2592]|nr:unnamed protein product [Symbiodinium sp. CCMP2592]